MGCDFFAFDCEMTGLHVEQDGNAMNRPPVFLDDAEDRYEAVGLVCVT